MDVISLGKAKKAKKAMESLRNRLGEGVEDVHDNVKIRLEELEKKDPSVALYNRVSEVEKNTAVNLNKHNLHVNTILNKSKFGLTELAFDDFADASGVDATKSVGHFFDSTGRKMKIADGQTQAEVVTTAEEAASTPHMITVSQTFNKQNTANVPANLTSGTLVDAEIVNGKIQLKAIDTRKSGEYSANIIPIMSSYSNGSIVVSASSEYNSTYQAWKAFNGTTVNNLDAWITLNGVVSGWLKIDLGAGNEKAIAKYNIIARNDGTAVNYSPKSWTLEASNTGAFTGEQVILDTQTNIIGWTAGIKKEFTLNNDILYRFYRINITGNSGGGTFTAIGELELMEETIQNLYSPSCSYESPILDCGENFKNLNKIESIINIPVSQVESAITPMTADTASVTASSTGFGAKWKAFNGGVVDSNDTWGTSGWSTAGKTDWIQYVFGATKTISQYAITSRDVSSRDSDPTAWKFQGSNNGIDYVDLDVQSGILFTQKERKIFNIATCGSYRFYRLFVTSVKNSSANAMWIGELEMLQTIGSQAELFIFTSASQDGLTFSDYLPLNTDGTIASPSGRYVKVKVELTGGGEVKERLVHNFAAEDSNAFQENEYITFNGTAKLKTSYSDPMIVDTSFTETGTLLKKVINKSSFKSIEKIEVFQN